MDFLHPRKLAFYQPFQHLFDVIITQLSRLQINTLAIELDELALDLDATPQTEDSVDFISETLADGSVALSEMS